MLLVRMINGIKHALKRAFEQLGYSIIRTSSLNLERRAAADMARQLSIAASERSQFHRRSPGVPTDASGGGSAPSQFYDLNGYYIFHHALPLETIARIRDIVAREVVPTDNLFLRHPTERREAHRYRVYGDGSGRKVVVNGLLNPHEQRETVNLGHALLSLVSSDAVTERLRQIDGEDSYTIHQIILFFVAPGTDLHIDAWPLDTVPPGHCHTLWIPLEEVTFSNGPIYIMPWPRGFLLQPEDLDIPSFVPEEDSTRRAYHTYHDRFVRHVQRNGAICALPRFDPGDFIVFSSLTPHGTLPAHPHHLSRLAMQVLVRPSRLPWNSLLASFSGDPPNFSPGKTAVNDRWRMM